MAHGWSAGVEQRYRGGKGLLKKPNLALMKSDQLIIGDVAVHWKGPDPLQRSFDHKIRHLHHTIILGGCLSPALGAEQHLRISSGDSCTRNSTLLEAVGADYTDMCTLVAGVLQGCWMNDS